jgi:hypothetical protein
MITATTSGARQARWSSVVRAAAVTYLEFGITPFSRHAETLSPVLIAPFTSHPTK